MKIQNLLQELIQNKNLREVRTPIWKVFTQEYYKLYVQQVVQYYQEKEGWYLYYHVLGLNDSSTEDDMKKFYRKVALWSHPVKNKHPQAYYVMRMINEDKEGLEDLLRYIDAMREQEEYL